IDKIAALRAITVNFRDTACEQAHRSNRDYPRKHSFIVLSWPIVIKWPNNEGIHSEHPYVAFNCQVRSRLPGRICRGGIAGMRLDHGLVHGRAVHFISREMA